MDVLLVITNIDGSYRDAYSFGLASLASSIRASGYDYDFAFVNSLEDYKKIFNIVDEKHPKVIGYSSVSSQFMYVKEISKQIKEIASNTIVQVCGGIHTTIFPEAILEAEALNGIFIGESERAFCDFMGRVVNNQPYKDVKNFAYNNNGVLVKNGLYPLVTDLDKLPFPEREKYGYDKFVKWRGYATFMFSRGCPFSCSYCSNHAIAGAYDMKFNKPRYRSPASCIEEIKEVVERYSVSTVNLGDDTFGINKKWMKEFCNLYAEEIKLPLRVQLQISIVTEELMKYLKHAGCVHVSCGVESGNEYIRKEILKRTMTNEQIIDAYRLFKKYNMTASASNIIGAPHETIETIKDTIRLNRKIKPINSGVNIFYPYPGTSLGNYCFKEGFVDKDLFGDFSSERRDSILNFPQEFKDSLMYYKETWRDHVYPFYRTKKFFVRHLQSQSPQLLGLLKKFWKLITFNEKIIN